MSLEVRSYGEMVRRVGAVEVDRADSVLMVKMRAKKNQIVKNKDLQRNSRSLKIKNKTL